MTQPKTTEKEECKHRWRIGSYIPEISKTKTNRLRIKKIGINIWCESCRKKLKAYYSYK